MEPRVVLLLFCSLLLVGFAPALEFHGDGDLVTPTLAGNHAVVDDKMPHWLPAADAWMLTSRLDGIVVDAVVSPDGSGNYTTIGAAIDAAPRNSSTRHTIHVKQGVYMEYLNITRDICNLMLVGDGIDATVISGNKSVKGGYTTIYTATVSVQGKGFLARDLTIENTAGAIMEQAVAFMSESNHSALQRCAFRGYQDALYAYQNFNFTENVVSPVQSTLYLGMQQPSFRTAASSHAFLCSGSRTLLRLKDEWIPTETSGLPSSSAQSLLTKNFTVSTYLGRPWKEFSRVVFMQSFLSEAVHPNGWIPWNQSHLGLDTLYFAEFSNGGPGATVSARVRWPGVHSTLSTEEASKFTVGTFIDGDKWLPGTGINYTSGL